MKKDTIVHFIGFLTNLDADEFAPNWERYTKGFTTKKKENFFQQHITEKKSKLNFLSQHEGDMPLQSLSHSPERRSEHFPDHNVRVSQLGGYVLLNAPAKQRPLENDTKVIAFIGHGVTDTSFFQQPTCHAMRINQAYYESCLYGYIVEYFIAETDADALIDQLMKQTGVETGVYREYVLSPA